MRCAAIILILAGLVWPVAARADSGTGHINALPDSQELEGSVQITHECTGSVCFWFAEVSAYPGGVECPLTFDASHSVWSGPVEEGTNTTSGNFSFVPENPASSALCLYVNESDSALIGRVTWPTPESALPLPDAPVEPAPASKLTTPILAGPWASDQEGYGHVKPLTIYNGGDALGRITHIHWSSWGRTQAVGSGLSTWVAPRQSTAEGRFERAHVIAFHLGYCRGRRAYNAVEWYFPEHGQHFRSHTYIDSCTGQYRP